jgi:two-component system chemotaxis response regulator CheB
MSDGADVVGHDLDQPAREQLAMKQLTGRIDAVVIGASAGGIEALSVLLPAVRSGIRAAILIVVHLPRERESLLAKIFATRCPLPVKEAEDKEPIVPGTVYFAPPDYHLQVDVGPCVSLSYDEPVNWSRPSIDVLFASAADVFGDRLMGVLLTGGNQDGAAGLVAVRQAGGVTVVEDPSTASCPTMPSEALRLGAPDRILNLDALTSLMQAIP